MEGGSILNFAFTLSSPGGNIEDMEVKGHNCASKIHGFEDAHYHDMPKFNSP